MVKNNYNKVLTIILSIIVIAILIVVGFWGYDLFQKHYINEGANEILEEFDSAVGSGDTAVTEEQGEQGNKSNSNNSSTTSNTSSLKYKGYDIAGKIEIPATKIKYPVLTVATESSMKVSVGILYGAGLNQVGNTIIMGHNYRNGAFFSNNDKLKNGDEIYITDSTGKRIKYVIYNKYNTSSTDFEYATRDTAGKREITLESCTNDSKARIIIWAKEEN